MHRFRDVLELSTGFGVLSCLWSSAWLLSVHDSLLWRVALLHGRWLSRTAAMSPIQFNISESVTVDSTPIFFTSRVNMWGAVDVSLT